MELGLAFISLIKNIYSRDREDNLEITLNIYINYNCEISILKRTTHLLILSQTCQIMFHFSCFLSCTLKLRSLAIIAGNLH